MHFNRQELEEMEARNLSPYAIRSRDSKGRLHEENEHDYRTCFQRDRDRILHTSAFRRLEYKTQVFINHEGDYYRTRLTHTLEVAQIGRTIARALGANEDLVEAICLAHDIGHPPFGHSGEAILAKLMRDHGGFDHNKHSFRIVTALEQRFPDFPGLNLSWEVLEGMVKHETDYDLADADQFNPDLRGHLEAQITNVADELAYTAHDLDDGLRSGLITPNQLLGIELWNRVIADLRLDTMNLEDLERHQIIRRLIGVMVTDQIDSTSKRLDQNHVQSSIQLQNLSENVIGFSEKMLTMNKELKSFLYQNLYKQYRVIRMQTKAEKIISELFTAYVDSPNMLPPQYQVFLQTSDTHRVVCDYVAGMTDRFAIDEHDKLFNPHTLP